MMIETNKDKLLKLAVMGEIVPSGSSGYRPTWNGVPKMSLGMGGIKYNLRVGDLCYGWASGDHVEPGVTIRGKEKSVPSQCALALLACIGNKARLTSGEATMTAGQDFGKSLGKTIVIAQDAPGFIVNRLMVPQILIAIRMLESGAATREDIDTSLTLGLNHPMGPLALADLVGLDTLLFIANGIYEELRDHIYIAPTLLRKMVAAGWLGSKTGKGFYEYKK